MLLRYVTVLVRIMTASLWQWLAPIQGITLILYFVFIEESSLRTLVAYPLGFGVVWDFLCLTIVYGMRRGVTKLLTHIPHANWLLALQPVMQSAERAALFHLWLQIFSVSSLVFL